MAVSISERRKELKRRRHRREVYAKIKAKLPKMKVSEKAVVAQKLRALTPGCEVVIANFKLEERN